MTELAPTLLAYGRKDGAEKYSLNPPENLNLEIKYPKPTL